MEFAYDWSGYDWEREEAAWYALRTQPKREEIASIHIREETPYETFSPRLRVMKKTRTGKRWYVEALFPGYVFARCPIHTCYRHLLSLKGVTGVVRYGVFVPVVADRVIAGLREQLGEEVLTIPERTLQRGEEVVIVEGPLAGMTAMVAATLPARRRVALLLDFLGRQIELQIQTQHVMQKEEARGRQSVPNLAFHLGYANSTAFRS